MQSCSNSVSAWEVETDSSRMLSLPQMPKASQIWVSEIGLDKVAPAGRA